MHGKLDRSGWVMAGRADVVVETSNSNSLQLTAGQCGVPCVTFATGLRALSDVPRLAEHGAPSSSYSTRTGRCAPAGAPPTGVERMAQALHYARSMGEAQECAGNEGADAVDLTTRQFNQLLVKEVAQKEMLLVNLLFEEQR